MKPHYLTYIIVCFLFFGYHLESHAQYYNTVVEAKIITSNTGDATLLELEATATNLSEVNQNLHFVFTIFKNSNSENASKNTSKNLQDGNFFLVPSEKKNLSKTTINFNNDDEIIVLLLIYNTDDKLIGKDRVVFNEKNTIPTEKIVQDEKSFEATYFKGLVTQDTKTKAGRDFYRLFESTYRQKQINGKEIVNIKEVFGLGRNTNIEVYAGQKLIYKFSARPKEDFIKAVTKQSIYLVVKHFQNLEKLEKEIQQY
jgi:hypothetical protein